MNWARFNRAVSARKATAQQRAMELRDDNRPGRWSKLGIQSACA